VAAVDQLTKAAIVALIGPARPDQRVALVGDWLALEYVQNQGVAFGVLTGLGPVLPLVALAIVAGLLVYYSRETQPAAWRAVAVGAIAGGALGNLIDRLRLGYVVDFIAVGPWPNFNVADSAVTLGVLALVWSWIRLGDRLPADREDL
jgi:signal peptidase II